MSDYISKQGVFDAIQKKANEAIEKGEADYAAGLVEALSVVTHFPAADVALVKTLTA